jgi:hypothetical protein
MDQFALSQSLVKALDYLTSQSVEGNFASYLSMYRDMRESKSSPPELFSTILILDNLKKSNHSPEFFERSVKYISEQVKDGLLTFFEDKNLYPPDADTNSLGFSLLLSEGYCSPLEANKVLDNILEFRNKENLAQVWLTEKRDNCLDHVVSSNILYFASQLNRASELSETKEWLKDTLETGAYLHGSRYYHSPDAFLFFLGRLIEFPEMHDLIPNLTSSLRDRSGIEANPLELAMRLSLASELKVEDGVDKDKLLLLQQQDGSWPADALFHYGGKVGYFGSKALVTSFGIRALSNLL